ncbi:hypothetical protein TNCV_966431 [Trichonephila clavipes]|nr:hypothetical protein TNCV_966431 [Trichonephila clavipes]
MGIDMLVRYHAEDTSRHTARAETVDDKCIPSNDVFKKSECSTNLIRWPAHAALPSKRVGEKGGAVDYENGLSGSSADRLAPEWGNAWGYEDLRVVPNTGNVKTYSELGTSEKSIALCSREAIQPAPNFHIHRQVLKAQTSAYNDMYRHLEDFSIDHNHCLLIGLMQLTLMVSVKKEKAIIDSSQHQHFDLQWCQPIPYGVTE